MKNLLSLCLLVICALTATAQSPLEGKRIAVFGDSYARNHREPIENTWHYKFAKRHGMQYFNHGRNGNCVSIDRARFGQAMYKRYTELPDSLDCILLIAGHNDAALLDSIGVDTYRVRLGQLCDSLIARYPKANILFFTCWNGAGFDHNNFRQIVDATIDVCGQYSIPVFDAARRGNIYAHSDAFRAEYFQNKGVNDHAHLNAKGHDRFLPVAEAFVLPYLSY
ncbi:MAG: SGNH/GDSL hydrolase family protein [Muribaculum sp.]|nr:SGNH/GDSL hydrolase family protein [Muribaculaceae bacterium]MCM1080909.1 SGNH/GDSL hydrolase family protein [Muribaculum sp.]